jgi:glutamine amidotransferase
MKTCLILDYGVGNIGSVSSFFKENNYQVTFGNTSEQISNTELLVLPGVGAFKQASQNLEKFNLKVPLKERHLENKPILGICLGLQLLTESSAESPGSIGIGILNGKTQRLRDYSRIGWDAIRFSDSNSLLKESFYFNHSYAAYGITGNRFNADSKSGGYRALIVENNSIGVQFHPEKSQESGTRFLKWAEETVWVIND